MLDVAGYLHRLGFPEPPPPTLDTLFELHRAQIERVPYTTFDIHLGRPCPLDPVQAVDRIVRVGHTGYCFNLNGAFAALLASLRFDVREHRGWVWGDPETPREPVANHLALTVHGLPDPVAPAGVWLVDVGLGDALHEPLPLVAGEYEQGPFSYRLAKVPAGPDWRFHHDPAGSFAGMDFELAVAEPGAFEASHAFRSTSPESSFMRNVTAQRRDGTGIDKLINCSVLRIDGLRTVTWDVTSPTEWFAALADVFGLPLDDLDAADRARLWEHAQVGHAGWLRSQHVG